MMTIEEIKSKVGELFGTSDGQVAMLVDVDEEYAYMVMLSGEKVKSRLDHMCSSQEEAEGATSSNN